MKNEGICKIAIFHMGYIINAPTSVLNFTVLDTTTSGQQNVIRICRPFLPLSVLLQFSLTQWHSHTALHYTQRFNYTSSSSTEEYWFLWARWSGDQIQMGGQNFLHPFTPVLGLTQTPIQWVPGFFPRDKAAGVWHWQPTHPHIALMLKKEKSYTSTPSLDFHGLF